MSGRVRAIGAPVRFVTSLMPARNPHAVIGIVLFVLLLVFAACGPFVAHFDPFRTGVGAVMAPPDWRFIFGTDDLGRDVFSRACFGIGTSIEVGLVSAAISTLVGTAVGAPAGYFGGLFDDLLMRITELFQVIPRFFLAILLVAILGASIATILLAISILSWPECARIVRAEMLALRDRQFVAASRIAGAGNWHLIFVECLPNAAAPVVVSATLQVGQAILLEAGLSYLGLGDPNRISLGLMLRDAQDIMAPAWWTAAFPGVLIFLAVLAINLLGDGLNEMLDPRARSR